MKSFASDNNAGAHPEVLRAIEAANHEHVRGYGDDPYTEAAIEKLREHFGADTEVFFVFTGTAANVLGLAGAVQPHHAVLCPQSAHLQNDECGAPERFLGTKLVTTPTPDGKLRPEQIARAYRGIGDPHHVQLRAVSVSNATEVGTVYSAAELRALADAAHARDLVLHVDGARLANAAVAQGASLRAITRDAGVDVLSFGGTKNGLLYGEAVLFFDRALARDFAFRRKQSMQLASKMRFIAAQFTALLSDGLWQKSAAHANAMARRLAEQLRGVPNLSMRAVESNAVFATIPADRIAPLQAHAFFYVWDESTSEVRWMTAFDTTAAEVDAFARVIREALAGPA